MNALAAQASPCCGLAISIRSTLNAPTMTFSLQYRSTTANTVQWCSSTPTSGAVLARIRKKAESGQRRAATAGGAMEMKIRHEGPAALHRPRARHGDGRGGDHRRVGFRAGL